MKRSIMYPIPTSVKTITTTSYMGLVKINYCGVVGSAAATNDIGIVITMSALSKIKDAFPLKILIGIQNLASRAFLDVLQ